MNMTDEQFQQAIALICGNMGLTSSERRKAINRLLIALQQLPQLCKSSHPLYFEALDKTWEWVSENICTFQPKPHLSIQRSLVNWINGYLRWRIKDLYQNSQSDQEYSLDVLINENDGNQTRWLDQLSETGFNPPKLSGLDAYLEERRREKNRMIWQRFHNYVTEDPEKRLQNCHPRQHPNCHCQYLCQQLLFQEPPEPLAKISRELGVNYQTLNSHWKNRCLPLLQQILEALGYSRNE
ncbi:MAG: hypothetical protein RIC07_19570 [Coleofasciculus sp. E1-EBD-02]